MKIFGLGLSKTGTTSLHEALQILGYRSIHYSPDRLRGVLEGRDRTPDFHCYEDVDAVLDLPVPLFYEELLLAYPDSRCILTTRDEDAWWLSIWFHFTQAAHPNEFRDHEPLRLQVREFIFGSSYPHEFLFRKRYREHTDRVLARVPDSRLLVMDITAGDGWDVLCPFLGVETPAARFPHANDFAAGPLGPQYLATKEIAELVPPDESLILVDERLWRDEPIAGRLTLPFLPRDGRSWRHPPDDESAIRRLEELRQVGPEYIVFAWPAFWWLHRYPELHRLLRSAGTCCLENDRLVVFSLH